MQIKVTFRNVDSSEHVRQFVEEKLSRFEKYLDSAAEAHVVLSVEKFRHSADVTLSSNGLRIKGAEETEDMYSAIDLVLDKIEGQVKRALAKRKDHKGQAHEKIKTMEFGPEAVEAVRPDEADETAMVKTQRVQAKPMDVDEAIMQLELSEDDFLVFSNARTKVINVVYRRKDGHLGLIEPA